ncbi:hypothetical protein ACFWUZ_34305 [Streptomyces sp. NPDC058646]|uniref:hypothetical protein n=1 Tax=Streptomyces sp. NPDC058646 TaxID=3346574 RepID=UPI00365B7290
MTEERDRFALPQQTRCRIWVVAAAVFLIVGVISPQVTPLMLAATILSPLGLYMCAELIGSPMSLTDQLKFSWLRARDSVCAASRQPGEAMALACVALAWLFLAVRAIA